MTYNEITSILKDEADNLLNHQCSKISKDLITAPGPKSMGQVFKYSDRSPAVIKSLKRLYHHGRLSGTGYLSILPVDQDIEHTAAYSFYHNPIYFDPENVVKLAIEGGCNGVASTLGTLGLVASYAKDLPFIVKLNHNELLTYPTKHDQHMFAQVQQAANMGAVAVGATIYFGSKHSNRQIEEVSWAFAQAHELGLATILWCYPRNEAFHTQKTNYERSADITAQAIRLGVTIEADIVKQKMPTSMAGFKAVDFAKYSDIMYQKLLTKHPIDMVRFQVLHAYAGKVGLLNSGGATDADNDLSQAVKSAVINKRAGGQGLIMGRKAFSRPMEEGIAILHAVQDVYLEEEIGLA